MFAEIKFTGRYWSWFLAAKQNGWSTRGLPLNFWLNHSDVSTEASEISYCLDSSLHWAERICINSRVLSVSYPTVCILFLCSTCKNFRNWTGCSQSGWSGCPVLERVMWPNTESRYLKIILLKSIQNSIIFEYGTSHWGIANIFIKEQMIFLLDLFSSKCFSRICKSNL